jgi:cell division protein FtsQ
VAALTIGGTHTAVAADGIVLGSSLLSGSLPALVSGEQGGIEPLEGQRVHGDSLLAELTVLGAAPAPLVRVTSRMFTGPEGLTAAMRNGLLVYFGDATRPHAKWLSLARVLADPSSAGASYVDVRLPERPAAGFSSGVAPSDGAASTAGQVSTPESTVAALAEGLTATTSGGSSAAGGSTPVGGSTSTTGAESTATPEAASTSGAAQSTSTSGSETPAPEG